MSGATLALFESAAQLDLLLAWRERDGASCELVAATAAAELAALQRGLACATIEDIVDEAETKKEGRALFDRLFIFASWLDDFISKRLGEDISSWFATLDFTYCLKLSLDRVYYRIVLLARLFDVSRPARVIGFSSAFSDQGIEQRQNMLPHRSTLMQALPWVAVAHNVEAVLLPCPDVAPRGGGEEQRRPDQWRELLRQVEEIRKNAADPVRFLVIGPYWSGSDILSQAQSQGMPAIRLHLLTDGLPEAQPSDVELAKAIWDEVRRSQPYRDLLTFEGIDLSALADCVFGPVVTVFLPRQRSQAPALAERLRALGDAVLVTSSAVLPSMPTAFRAARAAGVPSVVIQHGGMWYFNALTTYFTDVYPPEHYLCYGEGAVASLAAQREGLAEAHRGRAQLTVIGCPQTFGVYGQTTAPREAGRGVRVLYLTTSLSGEEYYFGTSRCPDIAYARIQRQIVSHCAGRADLELTVRPPPGGGGGGLHDWLMTTRPGCRYAPNGPLQPLLLDADVIVIDYVPSSVLLQAAATEARVLTLYRPPPLSDLWPPARDALARRAQITESVEALLGAIDAAVADCAAERPNPLSDQTFLDLFANPRRIVPSVEAAAFLRRVNTDRERGAVI